MTDLTRINDYITLHRWGDGGVAYELRCPGCDHIHLFTTKAPRKYPDSPTWDFDGNMDSPTFSPSFLTYWPDKEDEYKCHSYLRNGVWEFLSDCTHRHAGKKMGMVKL